VDVSAPSLSFSNLTLTHGTTNTLAATASPASTITYSLVSGDTNKVTLTGSQLVVNSGTGSVVVRATTTETESRASAIADATITFTKASQTITFSPSSVTANVGDPDRLLLATSGSGETVTFTSSNPGVASINGSTITFHAAGSTIITASAPGNDNFLPATPVSQTFTVTSISFASLWGGQTANSDANGDGVTALVEYALGGTSGSNNRHVLPTFDTSNSVVGTNTNRILTLTALVRTNDSKLSVSPQFSATLASNSWSSNNFTTHETTAGVTNGFVRRTYTYDATTNPRAFLRLFITNSP